MEEISGPRASWTFLTNHSRVLVQIARDPGVRVRDIAARCLLTERAVQRIVADLEREGYLTHTRSGRGNRYQVCPGKPLRHPADAGPTVGDLLALLTPAAAADTPSSAPAEGEGHQNLAEAAPPPTGSHSLPGGEVDETVAPQAPGSGSGRSLRA